MLEKRLSEASKRHSETKTKLTKVEKSLQKTKTLAIDTLAAFDEFLGTEKPDKFVETYGVGEFVKSIKFVFNELRKHLQNSSGTNLLVSDSRLRYSEAQASCRDIGAQLVTILDEEKMQIVLDAVMGFKRWDIWIGLNRLNKKKYAWDTGEDLQYSSWGDGQPNWRDPYGKDGEEECVIMWSDGTWHDYNCRVRAYFVCEIPIHEEGDILQASKVAFDEKNKKIVDKSLDQPKSQEGPKTWKAKHPNTISEQQEMAKQKGSTVKSFEKPQKSQAGRIDTKAVYDDSQNKKKLTDPEYRDALIAEVEKQRKEREELKDKKQVQKKTERELIIEDILNLAGIKKRSPSEKKMMEELKFMDDEELEEYLEDYDDYDYDYEDYEDYEDEDYEDYEDENYQSEP